MICMGGSSRWTSAGNSVIHGGCCACAAGGASATAAGTCAGSPGSLDIAALCCGISCGFCEMALVCGCSGSVLAACPDVVAGSGSPLCVAIASPFLAGTAGCEAGPGGATSRGRGALSGSDRDVVTTGFGAAFSCHG